MVLALFGWDPLKDISKFFWRIIISLVSGIYQLVNYTYQVFLVLAETNIFEQSQYQQLTEKVYVILGVVMLFIIAYNILTLIVDPDKNKGGANIEKLLRNIVISFILIVICPTLFTFAFRVQDAILEQGVFSRFFDNTGVSGFDGENTIKKGGNMMALYTFSAFFTPSSSSGTYTSGLDAKVTSEDNCSTTSAKCTLKEAKDSVQEKGTFSVFKAFAGNIASDEIEFDWLIALIAGGYLVYVIISFCFDLAIRVVKLAFYQIIAPVTIACRILPDKESIFKNWWKATVKTYLSVFIRVLIMNLGIYLISIFVQSNFFESACANSECTGTVVLVAYAFIVLGIVTFIRQAPKLLDEIFGLGMGDMKLGIKEKLREGGVFTAGAAVGAGATAMTRNATHAVNNVANAKGFAGKSAAVLRGIGSTVTGAAMGSYRGARSGWKAANASDMANAARKGASETIERRDAREAYRASHNLGPISGTTPFIGGIATVAGHATDVGKSAVRWTGVGNVDALIAQNKQIDEVSGAVDAVKDAARDVLISDATVKNKGGVTYGVTAGPFTDVIEGHNFEFAYNTDSYITMNNLVKDARASGSDKVKIKDSTGVEREISTNSLEAEMGKFAKSFSEQMANVAAKTSKDWETYQQTNTKDALALDKVRSKAVDLRNILEQNINSEVIAKANEQSRAKGGSQQITVEVLRTKDLQFDGDNALGGLGDQAKLLKQTNNDKITRRRVEDNKNKK